VGAWEDCAGPNHSLAWGEPDEWLPLIYRQFAVVIVFKRPKCARAVEVPPNEALPLQYPKCPCRSRFPR